MTKRTDRSNAEKLAKRAEKLVALNREIVADALNCAIFNAGISSIYGASVIQKVSELDKIGSIAINRDIDNALILAIKKSLKGI